MWLLPELLRHQIRRAAPHPNGFRNIYYVHTLTATGTNGVNACQTHYNRSSDALYLLNDAGTAWQYLGFGANDAVSNSQCTLRRSGTSVTGTGNDLVLALNIEYTAGFVSQTPRDVHAIAVDYGQASSGWQRLGAWRVSEPNRAPTSALTAVPVGPGGGGVFTIRVTDADGASDAELVHLLVNNTINGANSCFVHYRRSNGGMALMDDSGGVWLG